MTVPFALLFAFYLFSLGHFDFYLLDYVTLNRILKCGDWKKNWTSSQNIQNYSNFQSVIATNDTYSNLQLYPSLKDQIMCYYLNFIHFKLHVI